MPTNPDPTNNGGHTFDEMTEANTAMLKLILERISELQESVNFLKQQIADLQDQMKND